MQAGGGVEKESRGSSATHVCGRWKGGGIVRLRLPRSCSQPRQHCITHGLGAAKVLVISNDVRVELGPGDVRVARQLRAANAPELRARKHLGVAAASVVDVSAHKKLAS